MAWLNTALNIGSMKTPILLSLLILLSWNCRTAGHDGGIAVNSGHADAASRRSGAEYPALDPRLIGAPDFFSATLLTRESDIKIKRGNDASVFQSSFGATEKMRCLVYHHRLILPVLLQAIANRLRASFSETQIVFLNTGVFGSRPFLESHISYSIRKKGEKSRGVIKLIGASFPDNSVLCLHDEPGYEQVFRHVVGRFVESLHFTSLSRAPFYREVHVYTKSDIRLGFRETVMFHRKGAGRLNDTEESVFLPQANGVVQTRYSSSRSLLDSAGRIERAEYRADENGRILYELIIVRVGAESEYKITGKYRGRRIRRGLLVPGGLPGEMMRRRRMLDWLRSSKRETPLNMIIYMPALDPLRPIPLEVQSVSENESGGGSVVRYSVGGMNIQAVIDERGREISSRIEQQGGAVHSLRLFTQGTP